MHFQTRFLGRFFRRISNGNRGEFNSRQQHTVWCLSWQGRTRFAPKQSVFVPRRTYEYKKFELATCSSCGFDPARLFSANDRPRRSSCLPHIIYFSGLQSHPFPGPLTDSQLRSLYLRHCFPAARCVRAHCILENGLPWKRRSYYVQS